jgi:hypothetical protein
MAAAAQQKLLIRAEIFAELTILPVVGQQGPSLHKSEANRFAVRWLVADEGFVCDR